jgi:DNA-binding HxlR family transcriptional regulator
MQRKSFGNMQCPIARSLERVGEWWSILILRDALHGLTRFDQFQKSLDIAPNMLTRRLNALVKAGLLERRRYSERPPRYEYQLTERGATSDRYCWHCSPGATNTSRRKARACCSPTATPARLRSLFWSIARPADGSPKPTMSRSPAPLRTSEHAEGSPLPRDNAMSDAAVDRVVLPIPVRAPSGALRKRVLIACIALVVAVGAAWYGHYWLDRSAFY